MDGRMEEEKQQQKHFEHAFNVVYCLQGTVRPSPDHTAMALLLLSSHVDTEVYVSHL